MDLIYEAENLFSDSPMVIATSSKSAIAEPRYEDVILTAGRILENTSFYSI
jgi:hypothetical protein